MCYFDGDDLLHLVEITFDPNVHCQSTLLPEITNFLAFETTQRGYVCGDLLLHYIHEILSDYPIVFQSSRAQIH